MYALQEEYEYRVSKSIINIEYDVKGHQNHDGKDAKEMDDLKQQNTNLLVNE